MTESFRKYCDPRTLARLQGLELRARHVIEGYLSGLHRSPYHGFSIEFAEHREYAPGDDLRYVDWKVFGRTDKVYVKQYEEETNLVAYLLLDTSESMSYQGEQSPWSKLECTKTAAAVLAYLVLRQQDSVGVATFAEQMEQMVRASSSPSHLKTVLHVLEEAQPRGKTRAGQTFHRLAQRMQKRSVVLIFSDLFDDTRGVLRGLKHLRHRRHDVVVFHVLDPDELEFPFQQTTLFEGMEELPEVLTEPASLRRAYLREFQGFLTEVRRGCRENGLEYVPLRTDESLEVVLRSFLHARMARAAQ